MAVTESSKKATEVQSPETEQGSFWTPGRVAITLIVGVLVVGYAISRWSSNGNIKTSTTTTPSTCALNRVFRTETLLP